MPEQVPTLQVQPCWPMQSTRSMSESQESGCPAQLPESVQPSVDARSRVERRARQDRAGALGIRRGAVPAQADIARRRIVGPGGAGSKGGKDDDCERGHRIDGSGRSKGIAIHTLGHFADMVPPSSMCGRPFYEVRPRFVGEPLAQSHDGVETPPVLTVADTAFAIAVVRADEADLPSAERLFEDPFAQIFASAGAHAAEGTKDAPSCPGSASVYPSPHALPRRLRSRRAV